MTTPGLQEENKTKPEIARKIAELADEVHPDKIVYGKTIISTRYLIKYNTFNFPRLNLIKIAD